MKGLSYTCTMLSLSLFVGCGSSATIPIVYQPLATDSVLSFFVNGVPFGASQADSCTVLTSIDPTRVAGKDYLRLWLLYVNNSSSRVLLDPQQICTIKLKGDFKIPDLVPSTPSALLNEIENEKTKTIISQTIGGALQAIAASLNTQPTTITDPRGGQWQVNDRQERIDRKVDGITQQTQLANLQTSMLYDAFKNSVNAGLLRRNTLFSGQSVNGFIYFPLPEHGRPKPRLGLIGSDYHSFQPEEFLYELQIKTKDGSVVMEFRPEKGE